MNELIDREDEIRAKAATVQTIPQLAKALNAPISFAQSANERFDLGLDWIAPGRLGGPRPKQSALKADLPVLGKQRAKAKGDAA